jgi:hypothetical protein
MDVLTRYVFVYLCSQQSLSCLPSSFPTSLTLNSTIAAPTQL